MNLVSFVDELVKVGAMDPLIKRAEEESSSNISATEPPAGLIGSGSVPRSILVVPERASTRLSDSAGASTQLEAGSLGSVTGAKEPIDQDRFNRPVLSKR